ncbi:hypothetical protein K505DRAFT_108776 [Melanomma pulvis-pyrius CBS 109.77]|uniref:Uncharacterized protein n=1 Tax=Melanomma pulvis-pyrius CBS 109.77 TaxID=1314802 RepID=A0A6A6XS22_9PLEO|nr:hypothetical protein K505DRAFT_108776 [Melanomma pulvis-pyrius CBS 109.77]
MKTGAKTKAVSQHKGGSKPNAATKLGGVKTPKTKANLKTKTNSQTTNGQDSTINISNRLLDGNFSTGFPFSPYSIQDDFNYNGAGQTGFYNTELGQFTGLPTYGEHAMVPTQNPYSNDGSRGMNHLDSNEQYGNSRLHGDFKGYGTPARSSSPADDHSDGEHVDAIRHSDDSSIDIIKDEDHERDGFPNDSASEYEEVCATSKMKKDGAPRKPRLPRAKLLKWSDNDWKQVILGIVWACGEAHVNIPFGQAAQFVKPSCTAGALQQAILKLRQKLNSEGAQIPTLKMAWTRNKAQSLTNVTQGFGSRPMMAKRKPTTTQHAQTKLVTIRRAYVEEARSELPYPYSFYPQESDYRSEDGRPQDEAIRDPNAMPQFRNIFIPGQSQDHTSSSSAFVSPQLSVASVMSLLRHQQNQMSGFDPNYPQSRLSLNNPSIESFGATSNIASNGGSFPTFNSPRGGMSLQPLHTISHPGFNDMSPPAVGALSSQKVNGLPSHGHCGLYGQNFGGLSGQDPDGLSYQELGIRSRHGSDGQSSRQESSRQSSEALGSHDSHMYSGYSRQGYDGQYDPMLNNQFGVQSNEKPDGQFNHGFGGHSSQEFGDYSSDVLGSQVNQEFDDYPSLGIGGQVGQASSNQFGQGFSTQPRHAYSGQTNTASDNPTRQPFAGLASRIHGVPPRPEVNLEACQERFTRPQLRQHHPFRPHHSVPVSSTQNNYFEHQPSNDTAPSQ